MNGTDLLRAMSHVDEEYIQAAGEETPKRARRALLRYGGLAACAAVAVAGALLLRQPVPAPVEPTPAPEPMPSETVYPNIPDRFPTKEPVTDAPRLTIDLSRIAVNEMEDGVPSGCLSADFYITHEEVEWSEEEIAAWYGKTDFAPAFLPDGLTPAQENGWATVWTDEDGEVVIDLLSFSAKDEGDERIFPRSLTLSVSKNDPRPFRDWLHWGETWETCEIAGVEVTIVHAVYSHGPYDPETHEPSGYYDWYDVDFELDGLRYGLSTQRLDLEEVTAVTASVITGGTDGFVIESRGTDEMPEADPPEPPEAVPTPGA